MGDAVASAAPAASTELWIHIEGTGEEIEVPGEVVSQNVGPRLESGRAGMGLRFLDMKPEVAQKLEALYERKLNEAARG